MLKRLLLAGMMFFLAQAGWAQADTQAPAKEPVLIVVDIQNFYFPKGGFALEGPEQAAAQAAKLLAFFRAKKWPVIHVRHVPPQADDKNPQFAIHDKVKPLAGEKVITKHQINAFRDTDLLSHLQAQRLKRVLICGMQTHMCVEALARAAADAGFEVAVAADACATRKLEFGGQVVPAAQVHAAALAALSEGGYAKIMGTEECLAGLGAAGMK